MSVNFLMRNLCSKHRLLLSKSHIVMPTATFMKLKIPEKEEEVEFPGEKNIRWRLLTFDKVPQTTQGINYKMTKLKDRTRGPELVHNTLLYGQYGIQALSGGRLKWSHLNMIRLVVNKKLTENKSFATWRVSQPWQAVSKKGSGKRMGGGQGSINHYVYPVKANRIIFEIGGKIEFEEVELMLKNLAMKMPFKARVVTKEQLEREVIVEKELEEKNINPFTFEKCVKNNYNGVRIYMSPFDVMYGGKY